MDNMTTHWVLRAEREQFRVEYSRGKEPQEDERTNGSVAHLVLLPWDN